MSRYDNAHGSWRKRLSSRRHNDKERRWKPCLRNSRINIGLRRLRLRRMKFVREQFWLAATVQNMERLVRFLSQSAKPLAGRQLESERNSPVLTPHRNTAVPIKLLFLYLTGDIHHSECGRLRMSDRHFAAMSLVSSNFHCLSESNFLLLCGSVVFVWFGGQMLRQRLRAAQALQELEQSCRCGRRLCLREVCCAPRFEYSLPLYLTFHVRLHGKILLPVAHSDRSVDTIRR